MQISVLKLQKFQPEFESDVVERDSFSPLGR